MAIAVRDMRREDFDGVQAIFRELHSVHVDGRPDWFKPSRDPMSQVVFDTMFAQECLALVAELDGEVVGFCSGYVRRSSETDVQTSQAYMYIENFATLEKVRRKGVGRALVEASKLRAREMGYDRLGITVWAFNQGAYDFYRAVGFKDRTISLEMEI